MSELETCMYALELLWLEKLFSEEIALKLSLLEVFA